MNTCKQYDLLGSISDNRFSFIKTFGLKTSMCIAFSGQNNVGKSGHLIHLLSTIFSGKKYFGAKTDFVKDAGIVWFDSDSQGNQNLVNRIFSLSYPNTSFDNKLNYFNELAGPEFTSEQQEDFIRKIKAYGPPGRFNGDEKNDKDILNTIKSIIKENKATIVVIDSLTGLTTTEENGSKQKDVVYSLQELAKELDILLFIICHQSDKGNSPSAIRGHSGAVDAFDDVITLSTGSDSLSTMTWRKSRTDGLKYANIIYKYTGYAPEQSSKFDESSEQVLKNILDSGYRGAEIKPIEIYKSTNLSKKGIYDKDGNITPYYDDSDKKDKENTIKEFIIENKNISNQKIKELLIERGFTIGKNSKFINEVKKIRDDLGGK